MPAQRPPGTLVTASTAAAAAAVTEALRPRYWLAATTTGTAGTPANATFNPAAAMAWMAGAGVAGVPYTAWAPGAVSGAGGRGVVAVGRAEAGGANGTGVEWVEAAPSVPQPYVCKRGERAAIDTECTFI